MKLALSSLPRSKPRRQGFTLLEVALALAIFLIGALALVRIFPGGLSVVEQSENTLRASDINKATLARLTNNGSVPRSVFYGDLATNPVAPTWRNFNGAVLGPTRQNIALPLSSGLDSFYASALPNMITIQGEPARIQVDTKGTVVQTDDTNYLLTQFPIAFRRDAVNGADTASKVNIFEDDEIEGAQINSSGQVDLTKATFKSNGESVATKANGACGTTSCIFYVSYRFKYPSASTTISGVTDEPMAWQGAIGSTTYATRFGTDAVPGSISVRFRHLLASQAVTTDTEAHLGYVSTVPASTSFLTRNVAGPGTPVTLDYQAGWGSYSLVQDVPSLTPISQYSDTTDPTNPYAANATPATGEAQISLSAPYTFARGTLPLCALINSKGGLTQASFDGVTAPPANTILLKSDAQIEALPEAEREVASRERRYSLRTGRISFDMTGDAAKQVRVAYATRDSWVQQLSVSSSSYTFYNASATSIEPWRDYTVNNGYLYFHAPEAGKTVQVTYTTAASATPVTTVGTIEQRLITPTAPATLVTYAGLEFLPNGTNGGTSRIARLALYDTTGARVIPANILDVKGLSVSMRTAWMERDRWTQNIATTMRKEIQ